MYDIKSAAGLLRRKHHKLFFIAIIVFILSVFMMGTTLLILINQYCQINKDFMDNENTHIIEVASNDMDSDINGFKFSDIDKINELLTDHKDGYKLIPIYQFSIGVEMSGSYSGSCFIHGIENDSLKKLGMKELKTGEGIFILKNHSDDDFTATLKIPKIRISGGNGSSDELYTKKLHISQIPEKSMPLSTFEGIDSKLYVNMDTYRQIIQESYGVDFETFMKKYDSGENYMMSVLPYLYLYVDDLDSVEPVAQILEKNNYTTRYTFKAFDDFASSISTTQSLLLVLVSILFIVIAVILILYFYNYYKSQQKDIGILLHMGFARKEVLAIYTKNLRRCFGITLITGLIYSAAVGAAIVTYNKITAILLSSAAIAVIVAAIYFIIFAMVKRIINRDLMYLIKFSKEIE